MALTLFANFSMAQETPIEERVAAQTQAMAEKLSLTPEQKAQVGDINLAIARKNEAVRNDASMSEETKQQSYKGNKDARAQMIKPLLNADQLKTFEEMEANSRPTRAANVTKAPNLNFKEMEQKPAKAEPVKN